MFHITGKLVSKSLLKSGTGQNGEWKIVDFLIEKTRFKKKYKIPFVAKGRFADMIDKLPYNERIKIDFWIQGWKNEKTQRWFPNVEVLNITAAEKKMTYKEKTELFFNEKKKWQEIEPK